MGDDDVLWRELRNGPFGDRVAYGRLLREASGVSTADWLLDCETMSERRGVWAAGLLRLVQASGTALFAYFDLPPFSPQRSAVLLAGAEKLGIATDWEGWK